MSEIAQEGPLIHEAQALIDLAAERGIVLRLLGGLAIRFLCPDLPPRTRVGQDLDLCSRSSTRRELTAVLTEHGYEPDKMFNALNGDKQLYFSHEGKGHTVDVLIDKLHMCHTLDFAERLDRLPYTLDPIDLLLSKLQIVELNEKDVDDCLRLMVSFDFGESDDPQQMDLRVFRDVVGDDWGWWKTVTLNLDRIAGVVAQGERAAIAGGRLDPREQLDVLIQAAEEAPKSRRWKLRAKIGERKRWYEVPDEDPHD
jgi:hypothetical protein